MVVGLALLATVQAKEKLFDRVENQQLFLPEVPSKLDFDNQVVFAPDNDTQAQVCTIERRIPLKTTKEACGIPVNSAHCPSFVVKRGT